MAWARHKGDNYIRILFDQTAHLLISSEDLISIDIPRLLLDRIEAVGFLQMTKDLDDLHCPF